MYLHMRNYLDQPMSLAVVITTGVTRGGRFQVEARGHTAAGRRNHYRRYRAGQLWYGAIARCLTADATPTPPHGQL